MHGQALQQALPFDSVAPAEVEVLVWASRTDVAEQLARAAEGPGRDVRVVLDDAELARLVTQGGSSLLLAEDGPLLAVQHHLLRLPLILLRRDGQPATPKLARAAYAILARPVEAGLVIERFLEHRQVAAAVAQRRQPPRRCARCGRAYDAQAARRGTARRFVKFGSLALCGSCVALFHKLVTRTDTPFVEAERG